MGGKSQGFEKSKAIVFSNQESIPGMVVDDMRRPLFVTGMRCVLSLSAGLAG